jgi:hypothetical protein
MPFQRGKEKTGGRQKGSKNKVTVNIRERISDFVVRNFEDVENEFDQLKGYDKVRMFMSFIPYIIPKLQNVSTSLKYEDMREEDLNELVIRLISKIEEK